MGSTHVFQEQRTNKENKKLIKSYHKQIQDPKGSGKAILMGVCKGKISEGLDFSGRAARTVVVIGIPFANIYDPRVELKKAYLDYKRSVSYS